ncbi:YesL family protein [Salibacterium aidingense]|uniref:YesL family protein n=1 Tax=Salibacterium aidingense TaxID=384933 RepID=UPI003BC165AC
MGKGGLLFTFIISFCRWVCYFFYLNVMWAACTILGGVVFGIAPSTVALFAVARRTCLGEEEVPVFRTFWKVFRKEFFKANLLGLSLIGFGLLWYFNLNFFRAFDGAVFTGLNVVMTVIGVVFIFMLLYIFPTYVHYQMKFLQYIKYSIALSFINVANVILMIVSLLAAYYFFISFPGFIPICGVSLLAQMNMWLVYQSLKKMQIEAPSRQDYENVPA